MKKSESVKLKTTAVALLLLVATGAPPARARQFQQALPGYRFSFPKDHYSHDQFKTEWWYYTGHLATTDGKKYGYELTFFRTGVEESDKMQKSPWQLANIYLAHFAVTDEHNHKFHFYEKLNRAGLATAGASQDTYSVFNENWSVEALGDNYVLRADTPKFKLHLLLASDKPPVVHGKDGVSQKADCKGCASHYYSLTRLKSTGTLYIDGHPENVSGLSWMDHEFGSNQLTKEQVGWDWYSIQLDNNTELMLYMMRTASGGIDRNSSGTLVFADGHNEHLQLADFRVAATGSWTSPATGAKYPVGWKVDIPSRHISLTLKPVMADQELSTTRSTGVVYWEGACDVSGSSDNKNVTGQAYVEMTGYSERFRKNI